MHTLWIETGLESRVLSTASLVETRTVMLSLCKRAIMLFRRMNEEPELSLTTKSQNLPAQVEARMMAALQ